MKRVTDSRRSDVTGTLVAHWLSVPPVANLRGEAYRRFRVLETPCWIFDLYSKPRLSEYPASETIGPIVDHSVTGISFCNIIRILKSWTFIQLRMQCKYHDAPYPLWLIYKWVIYNPLLFPWKSFVAERTKIIAVYMVASFIKRRHRFETNWRGYFLYYRLSLTQASIGK